MKSKLLETGERFGRLTVLNLDRIEQKKHKTVVNGKEYIVNQNVEFYKCKCDCGNETIVRKQCLKAGDSKSCGCLDRELKEVRLKERWKDSFRTKKFGSKILYLLNAMKRRCYNPNAINYNRYGGKGITICSEWLDKTNGANNFYDWCIDNGYDGIKQIDRIDFKKGYEPNNCRFVTVLEQARNKSNNHFITYNGETHCVTEWVDIINQYNSNLKMTSRVLLLRINRYKMDVPLAFLTKVNHNTHHREAINELDFINFLNNRNGKQYL